MAELTTIARPYAQAIFSIAERDNELEKWEESLKFILMVFKDSYFESVLKNPNLTKRNLEQFLIETCDGKISEKLKSFIKLVISSGRIRVIPHICKIFFELKTKKEEKLDVKIISAFKIDDEQMIYLKENLVKKLEKKVNPIPIIDKSLIGGVQIHLGDKVWDLSIKGKLEKMAVELIK